MCRISALALCWLHMDFFLFVPLLVTLCDGLTLFVNSKHPPPPPFVTSLYRAPQTYDRGKVPKVLNPFIIVSKVRPCYSLESARQLARLKNAISQGALSGSTQLQKAGDLSPTTVTTTTVNGTSTNRLGPTVAPTELGPSTPGIVSTEFNGNWHIIQPPLKEGHNEQVIKYNTDGTREVPENIYKYHIRESQLLEAMKGNSEDRNVSRNRTEIVSIVNTTVHQPNQSIQQTYNHSSLTLEPLAFLSTSQPSNISPLLKQVTPTSDDVKPLYMDGAMNVSHDINHSKATDSTLAMFANDKTMATKEISTAFTIERVATSTDHSKAATTSAASTKVTKSFLPIINVIPTKNEQESLMVEIGDGAQNILTQIFQRLINGRQTSGLIHSENITGNHTVNNTNDTQRVLRLYEVQQNASLSNTGSLNLTTNSISSLFPSNNSQVLQNYTNYSANILSDKAGGHVSHTNDKLRDPHPKCDYVKSHPDFTAQVQLGDGNTSNGFTDTTISSVPHQPSLLDLLTSINKDQDDDKLSFDEDNDSFSESKHHSTVSSASVLHYSNKSTGNVVPVFILPNSTKDFGPFADLLPYHLNTTEFQFASTTSLHNNLNHDDTTQLSLDHSDSELHDGSLTTIHDTKSTSVTTVSLVVPSDIIGTTSCKDCNSSSIYEKSTVISIKGTIMPPLNETLATSTTAWRPLRPPIWTSSRSPPPPLVIHQWWNDKWNDSTGWFKDHSPQKSSLEETVTEEEKSTISSTRIPTDVSVLGYYLENATVNPSVIKYARLPAHLGERHKVTTYRPSGPLPEISPAHWLLGTSNTQSKHGGHTPMLINREIGTAAEQTLEPTPRNDSISIDDFEIIDFGSSPSRREETLASGTTGKAAPEDSQEKRLIEELNHTGNDSGHIIPLMHSESHQTSDFKSPDLTNRTLNISNFKMAEVDGEVTDEEKAAANTKTIITELGKLYSKLMFGLPIPVDIMQPLLMSKTTTKAKP